MRHSRLVIERFCCRRIEHARRRQLVPLLVSLQRISKIRTRISIERSRIGAQRFQSLLHQFLRPTGIGDDDGSAASLEERSGSVLTFCTSLSGLRTEERAFCSFCAFSLASYSRAGDLTFGTTAS